MKKINVLVGALILSALSFAEMETRTAYILIPSDVELKDVKVEGKTNDGESFTTTGGALVEVEGEDSFFQGSGVVIKPSNMNSFDGTQYIEVEIEVDEDIEAKFMAGYPVTGAVDPTYVYIADPGVKDNSTIENRFENASLSVDEVIDESAFDSFDAFPGKLLNEDIKISSFIVGDSEIGSEGQIAPSNIVDIYSKEGDTDVLGGGAEVSPNGAQPNNEFELWAVQYEVDSNGNVILEYEQSNDGSNIPDSGVPKLKLDEDDNPIKVLLYSNKDMESDPKYGDLSKMEIPNGQFYSSTDDSTFGGENSLWKFEVQVRFKNGGAIYVNDFDETVDLNKTGFRWDLYNLDSVVLTNEGNNPNQLKIILGVEGENVFIGLDKDGGEDYLPPSIGETLYVIDDDGDSKEINERIISKYQGVKRERNTKVNIKVFDESGAADHKSFDIDHISE